MKLSTMTFEFNADFLQWQDREKKKIFNVNMVSIDPDAGSPFKSQTTRPRLMICVVYYVEE